MNAYENVICAIAAQAKPSKQEYMDDEGVYRCTVCHKKTRTSLKLSDKEIEVHCACDCDEAEVNERKEREKADTIDTRKKVCFSQKIMRNWTFENDDRANPKMSDAMKRYADKFSQFLTESKGLLMYGPVGTGKSYYAACIANRIMDSGYTALMTNFASLVNSIHASEDKNEFIASLNRYDLLIIDDLGAERTSDYMCEIVFDIIDKRCTSGLPMIITTNLKGEDFKNPDDIRMERIYDRILERCFPIEISGNSRRRTEAKQSYAAMKDRLGL